MPTVPVVDDDPEIRSVIAFKLERAGDTVGWNWFWPAPPPTDAVDHDGRLVDMIGRAVEASR